jgi:hypothetical protein
VPGNSAAAGFRVDPRALPKVGEVFYGAVVAGSIGGCANSGAPQRATARIRVRR